MILIFEDQEKKALLSDMDTQRGLGAPIAHPHRVVTVFVCEQHRIVFGLGM